MKPIFNRSMKDATEEAKRSRIQRTLVQQGIAPVTDWTPRGPVVARVNENRWIADCPGEYCQGAEFVDTEWPMFVCMSCGEGPYEVAFPAAQEAVEGELLRRPDVGKRNWWPWEPVEQLALENAIMLDGAALFPVGEGD